MKVIRGSMMMNDMISMLMIEMDGTVDDLISMVFIGLLKIILINKG